MKQMLTRFIQPLPLRIACLLAAVAASAVMAEAPVRAEEGRIETVEIRRAPDDKPINAGTLLGGIAGDVIGHQIGSGRGNTVATVAGAIGGAVVGNEIENRRRRRDTASRSVSIRAAR